MYNAYVTIIKNLRKHPNADRLRLGECCGNTVCVDLSYSEAQVGVYFPTDGQLSMEFCEQNNLLRKKDESGNNIGGYMDADKRNVQAIKLRGEKSDGLFMPLSCLEYTGVDLDTLKIGDPITIVNGHEICTKYIPHKAIKSGSTGSVKKKSNPLKHSVAPLFFEHADTEQLAYNLREFRSGDYIEISLKMHGTSQRTAYTKVLTGYRFNHKFQGWLVDRYSDGKHKLNSIVAPLIRHALETAIPVYEWGYISGTRRTVLNDYDGGFYGSNKFREAHSKFFEGKLWKGETVYYEVVGFTDSGAPIMASADNKKLQDKDFVKQYGKTTVFSYGCDPNGIQSSGVTEKVVPQSALYVYRMTMTNEDGQVVEYPPHFVRYRCEQMGAACVPVLWKGEIPEMVNDDALTEEDRHNIENWVKNIAEKFYDGADPIGKTHVREGVVARIVNRPKFTAYKHKNWFFKALEGIVKVEADAPDIEEQEDLIKEAA